MIDHDALSAGFDAGNYGAAYDGLDLDASLAKAVFEHGLNLVSYDPDSPSFRAAFILGFFSSYERDEVPSDHLDAYEDALYSAAGRACVEAGYIDEEDGE